MANSFVRYTGNGTTTTYAIPFSYRDTADLSATVAGVSVTAYTLDAAGTNLTFTTAPANGAAIEIRRTTSQSTKLVDYVSGSVLTESDLDTDSDQAFYMSQEAIDKAGDVISLDNVDFNWDVQNKRLKNVADPVDNTDAVNKQFISTNIPNITTVAGISSDVTTVSGISSNVTTVANDATDIGTVATNIASVNTVATNINDVIKVADDLNEATSEIEVVANDAIDIGTVATDIANVNSVGTNIANVNSVAGNSTNINAVAGNETNINAVNSNSSNINTVAGISSDVTTVANDTADIGTVASDISNVNTVAGSIANVNTVATNVSDVNNFADRYRVQAGEPSVDNDEGDLVYDTTANAVKVYNGTSFDTIQQGITDVAPTRHSIRPSLNLDFANSKALDPRITFTRASNATYYDGYTSVKAEENLIPYSQDISQWNIQYNEGIVLTTNQTTAPDGTSTADKVTTNTDANAMHAWKPDSINVTSGDTYTVSAFLKQASGTPRFGFRTSNQSSTFCTFDLDSNSTHNVQNCTASIEDVGNSWKRCVMTWTTTQTAESIQFHLMESTSTVPWSYYTANGTDALFVWGAQLEQRDTLTAYTPTTSSPITKYQPALQTAGNNVARFDHNPITGESKGLLIEQGETNLSTYSEDVVNWYNTKAYSTLKSNVAIAPDGTLTADRVIKDNANANSYVGKNFSLTSGSSYTASVYVKKYQSSSSFNYVAITNESNSGNTAWFNLDTATVGTVRGTNASATITDVGNNWYRISYTWEETAGGTQTIYHRISDGDDDTTSTGNGFDGYFAWGFQLEAGTERMLSSYIKTEGSTVTRDSDEAVIYDIYTSDWLKQGKGTVYVETSYYDVNFFVTNLHFATLYQNRTGARFYVRYTAYDRVAFLLTDGTNNQTSTVSGANNSTLPNVNHKVAYSYATDKINFAVNGGAFTEDTTAKIGEFNIFYLTRSNSTSQKYNGHLKKIAYYPTNLTSNEIVDLTEE